MAKKSDCPRIKTGEVADEATLAAVPGPGPEAAVVPGHTADLAGPTRSRDLSLALRPPDQSHDQSHTHQPNLNEIPLDTTFKLWLSCASSFRLSCDITTSYPVEHVR